MFRRVKVYFEGKNDFRGFYFHSFVSLHIKNKLSPPQQLTVSLSCGATSDYYFSWEKLSFLLILEKNETLTLRNIPAIRYAA